MADVTIANLFFDLRDEEDKVGYVPLGPLYITSTLEEKGWEVEFRDYLVDSSSYGEPLDPQSICSFLDRSADILGISCASELLPLALLAVEKLKQVQPQKTVILGGIGPAGAAEEILQNFSSVDIVVRGEGEQTIGEVMARLKAGKEVGNVTGISYHQGDKVFSNPNRPRIRNLDGLPFPAYDRIKIDNYSHLGIYSGRGCPYRCTFCDVSPFWLRQNFNRSVENIIEEIILLMERYHQRRFDIMDDIFVLDKQRVLAFCEGIRKRNLDIEWACCGRIDLMDQELMVNMAESGCTWVFYGIESGSDNVLRRIRKGFSKAEARAVISESRQHFQVAASLMWGFPFETLEDFYETADLISFMGDRDCSVDLYLLAPLPFSPLYRQYSCCLELAEGKCSRILGAENREMLHFIHTYPGVSQWFYRYPTPHYQEKYEMVKYKI